MAGSITNETPAPIRTGGAPSAGLKRVILSAVILLPILAVIVFGPKLAARYEDYQLQKMSAPQLEAVIKKDPKNAQAMYRLGLAYSRDGHYREATQMFLAVLDREPVRADVLNDLGVTYLAQERYYESLVALNGALAARPDYPPAYANLGRLHLATKMPFTAVGELERANKLAPSDVDAVCDLGQAYQLTLNLQAAKRAYERAIAIDPKSLVAHVGLGKVEYSLAHYKDADRVLNQALALSPSDPQALLTLARLRLEQASSDSDFRAVQDLLERAAKADPTNADVWYDLGRVALQRKRTADAIQHLTKALQIYPGHNAAMHQLELAFRRAGRTADAERLAAVFQERVMREREETHLEEVVAHSPDDWDAQARLTEIYLKSGKRGLALLTYKRLTAGKRNHPALPKLLPQLNQELSGSQSAPSEPKGP